MREMTPSEWRAFLTEGTRTGKLATVRPDGRPHVAPIWFDLDDDGSILFTTWAESVKGRALALRPRVTMCVDDERPPFAYVIVEGEATMSTDPERLLYWAIRIAGRYMGPEQAEAYGRRNGVPGELLVRVTPTRVLARADIAD